MEFEVTKDAFISMLLISIPHGGGKGPSSPLSQMLFNDDSNSFGSSDGSDEETGKGRIFYLILNEQTLLMIVKVKHLFGHPCSRRMGRLCLLCSLTRSDFCIEFTLQ